MDFFHGAIALLAAVVLILAALVAWLYIQQSRTVQALNTLALAMTAPPHPPMAPPAEAVADVAAPAEVAATEVAAKDDRVSVYDEEDGVSTVIQEVEVPEIPGGVQVESVEEDGDDLSGKTISDLRSLLTSKGIPYNKKDSKPVLLALLKVAS